MNLRTICGGLGLLSMAWPAFGQYGQQQYAQYGQQQYAQHGQQQYAPYAPMQPNSDLRYPAGSNAAMPVGYNLASDGLPAAPMAPPAAPAAVPETTPTTGDCASCNSCATGCCPKPCCCSNMWEHETGIFADYLYLRPFGANVSHGIQQNGVGGLGTVPAGDVGVVSPEFDNGYRFGFEWALNCCSGIRATYTSYTTSGSDVLPAAGGIGGTAASLLLHPGTVTAASTFSELDANLDIDFRMVDIDYSVLISECESRAVNFNIGVRYAHLRQDFEQIGVFSGATGEEDTTSRIRFDGVGLRAGFDGQWRLGGSRIAAYGQGFINVLFGEFNSRYQQFNATTTTVEAASNWADDRCVPILDYEVGLRWTSCNGHWQASTGYYTAFWFNTVSTGEFVQAVQNNDFTHVDKTIAFTGLTTRVEYRF
jgi:Legionella pneumophila major outer membrane protein precursor